MGWAVAVGLRGLTLRQAWSKPTIAFGYEAQYRVVGPGGSLSFFPIQDVYDDSLTRSIKSNR